MPIVHLAARTTPGHAPFETIAAATWTWDRLRAGFPTALGAVLMPNHVHLVVDVADVADARSRFARSLGHLGRWWAPGRCVWERVQPGKVIAPGQPLHRELRYVALNPTRARLCRDPLAWPWTTHRDVMGAVVDPWVRVERLALALRSPAAELRKTWHRYVSSDPSVATDGSAMPIPAAPTDLSTRPLHVILCATGAALRIPAAFVRSVSRGRRLFIALARQQGWTDNAQLAASLGITPRGVRHEVAVDPAAIDAAALCLGDERLWGPFAIAEPAMREVA